MANWVLPMLLDDQTVADCPDKVLSVLARCSTGIILRHVNSYILQGEKNGSVSNRLAVDKLKKAYSAINEKAKYLGSDEMRTIVDVLRQLTYEDISAGANLDSLKRYRVYIKEVLNYDNDVNTNVVLDANNLDTCLWEIRDIVETTDLSEAEAVASWKIYDVIYDNKSLFKNAPFKKENYSILNKVMYRKDEFKVILEGLEFLIPRLEAGVSPTTWRYL